MLFELYRINQVNNMQVSILGTSLWTINCSLKMESSQNDYLKGSHFGVIIDYGVVIEM